MPESRALLFSASFVGAALVTFAATPAVGALARRLGVVDLPGGRRVHEQPTPARAGWRCSSG